MTWEIFLRKKEKSENNEFFFEYPLDLLRKRCNIWVISNCLGNTFTMEELKMAKKKAAAKKKTTAKKKTAKKKSKK